MYIYIVKLECIADDEKEFWAEFTVRAEDEDKAIDKTREKARKEGYQLRWEYEARAPIARKL